jgi:hypothetical protein
MMTERYDGYTIHTGFLGGNITSDELSDGGRPLDLNASCQKYAELLTAALEEKFPGAEVSVDYQVNASGSLPCTLETRVSMPDEGPAGDLEMMQEMDNLVESVDAISSRVWESWDWAVTA